MKPMLARTFGPRYDRYPCFVQPKLNGIRALYQSGSFTSRDEILWHPKVLAHLTEELSTIQDCLGTTILDGELYVHGWRLQRILSATAVKRTAPTCDTPQIEFHVFDCVDPSLNFSRRWLDLYNLLQQADLRHIRGVPTALAGGASDVELHFKLYTSCGYEGIMLRPDGPYEFGQHEGRNGNLTSKRSQNLWKYKYWEDDEFICVGYSDGEGKASIGIGSLQCMTKDQDGTFNVGTGFSDDERVEYMNNPPLGKLVKVRYLELTEAGIPFNPSFLAVLD